MFRKPREDPAPVVGETAVRPSTGRPPTPPSSTNAHNPPHANASTTYDMATATPLIGKPKSIQQRTPPTANTRAAKARGKANGNGNIMSFFKKAECTGTNGTLGKEGEISLFLEEDSVKIRGQAPLQTPTPPRDEGSPGDVEMVREESPISRYNEDTVPVKRRRLENAAAQPHLTDAACAPKAPREGPFVDDSDSDNEEPMPWDFNKSALKTQLGNNEAKTLKPPSPPESNLVIAGPGFPLPQLKPEATSVGLDNDFEGMDDFIDDEYPEDGEEYMERRWMEEQGELEMGLEDDDEDTGAMTTPKEECRDFPSIMPQDAGPACCPICGGSTAGMAEQVSQAYWHSSSCLIANSKYQDMSTTAWMVKRIHYPTQSCL